MSFLQWLLSGLTFWFEDAGLADDELRTIEEMFPGEEGELH